MSKKIVIAGGPHTGKSTLLERLYVEYAGKAHFIPEPATQLIARENDRLAANADYDPIYPWTRYREFADMVVDLSVSLESAIPEGQTAILDRSLIDNLGYAAMEGCLDLLPDMRRKAEAANYTTVLLCDFVGVYERTSIRDVDEKEARRIHSYLVNAYEGFGVPIVPMPPISIEERLVIARGAIGQ